MVLLLLLGVTVVVFGEVMPKHPEEEGESLPEKPGVWAQAEQEEMPVKGQKKQAPHKLKEVKLVEKKNIPTETPEEEDFHLKRTKKAKDDAKEAPATESKGKAHVPEASKEDDDADDGHDSKGAPAPAPLAQEEMVENYPTPKEDDADEAHSPEMVAALGATGDSKQHQDQKESLKDLRFSSLKDADVFAEYAHMSEEEFGKMAEEQTRPLREHLHKLITEQEKAMKEQADKDPKMKKYLELLEPERFKAMYPDHEKEKMLKENYPSPVDASKIRVNTADVIQKAIVHLTGGKNYLRKGCAEARRETGFNTHDGLVWDDYSEFNPALEVWEKAQPVTDDDEDDVESAHDELIKRESAPNQEKKTNTVRSTAVRVDANGDMVQMNLQEPVRQLADKSGDKSVRQVDDEKDKDRNKVDKTADVDSQKKGTQKQNSVYDDGLQSQDEIQRKQDEEKRSHYLALGGIVVAVLLIFWMYIRHRAQAMIERSTAFDDASSVSSSTITEENPTVKVNRALLERMATISQKLSEKVEEARASSNADSTSSDGSGARQYTRKKQKDPLLPSA